MAYNHQDKYYHLAKQKGLPSRASFKIEEIFKKFPILKAGNQVADLGAAPGGWTVMLSKFLGNHGKILALDLEELSISLPSNVEFLKGDLQSPEAHRWIEEKLGEKKLDAVLSDISPKLTGIFFKDAFISYELNLKVFEFAEKFLKTGGNLVSKIFPGEEFQIFQKKLRGKFDKVKVFEPDSSRKTSKEVYLIAMGFKSR